jgi:hypothetical protein
MMRRGAEWESANQAALVAALDAVHAALLQHAGRPIEPPRRDPAPIPEAPPAIDSLCAIFDLSPFERWLLLLCAGIELDGRFPEACAAAHGDGRRGHATLGLAFSVFGSPHWSAATRSRPLRAWRLIEIASGDGLISSPLRIDERILHFLTGTDVADERLEPVMRRQTADHDVAAFLAPTIETVARLLTTAPSRVQLVGRSASDRRAMAIAAFAAAGLMTHVVRGADLPALASERDTMAKLCARETRLTSSGIVIQTESADTTETARNVAIFAARLDAPCIIESVDAVTFQDLEAARVTIPSATSMERRQLWLHSLGAMAPRVNGELDTIVDHFDLDSQTIRQAASSIRLLPDDVRGDELKRTAWRICREHARPALSQIAREIVPNADWDSLVLPESQMETLRQITAHVRHRVTVHEHWGFAERYTRGLGITAMFAGMSGTGKTMAAEVLAHTLDLDLFQIDLASVVSKYIGETEKNLKRVFDAAEGTGAVLLFDEADSLFGKRTEVRDSHDRYANLEVSYLLQRMEAYRGLAVLTTNMRHAIDTAFLRRIRFIVEFPLPDLTDRARIWQRVFPKNTPTHALDPAKLARLNVAGGVIRNIAMQAAFFAADEGEPVGMPHILQAARVEYAKLDKPLTSSEAAALV